jgi:hypothetical protein
LVKVEADADTQTLHHAPTALVRYYREYMKIDLGISKLGLKLESAAHDD